jgi:hypothetical protein
MDTLEYASPTPPDNAASDPPPGGNALLRFLVHHNPFYLLSALCMIAGCFALNSALQTRTGELPKLLLLMGTLQLYELLLVGLGLYLIVKHRLDRDGRTLLLLDAVFLVDLTFLNNETAATNLWAGVLVNGLTLLLAVAKVALVMTTLSVRFPRRTFAFVVLQLVVLLGMPCMLKWVEQPGAMHAGITPLQLYTAWWAAGLVLVVFEMMRRLRPGADHSIAGPGVRRDVMRVYAAVPFLSIVAHLGMLHYVYNVTWHLTYAAPVLLGLGVILARDFSGRLLPTDGRILRATLPALAVAFSLPYPNALAFKLPAIDRALTPILLTVAAAYFTYVYAFVFRHALWYVGAGIVGISTYLFGPTASQTVTTLDTARQWSLSAVRRLIPRTAISWGIIAIIFSFAFLGVGAVLSLRKRAPRMQGGAPSQ